MTLGSSIPVLCYHSIGPGARLGPGRFRVHLQALKESGLPSLTPLDMDSSASGFLLTFDDGFADLWTHGLPLLREHGVRATVFAIPSRAGDGPARSPGELLSHLNAGAAHEGAARSGGPHDGFLRWSELRALEASGLVAVQSHSYSHRMGWVGAEITGFHLGRFGKAHWSLRQCTEGDVRLGIPIHPRGSALAHRLYRDGGALRDRLACWLEERGGEAYVEERGAKTVEEELRVEAAKERAAGVWETEEERRSRTMEEILRAREALETRLGGRRDELCLPWGEYDRMTLECAREAGIRRIYTLDRGPNPAGRVGFLVSRFEPRVKGRLWLRSRLWIYRSSLRARLYGLLSGRGTPSWARQ